MSPLPGFFASEIQGHLSAPAFQGDFWALNTVTAPSGGLAAFTMIGIPQNYSHLQIRLLTRSTGANVSLRFNDDTGTNYWTHWLDGNGTVARGESSGATNLIYAGYGAPTTASTNTFGSGIIDILDYGSTIKTKVTRSLVGYNSDTAGFLGLVGGMWNNKSAINSITFIPNSGSFAEFSSFALYGVK
jgi:hypothetical protein